MPQIENDNVLLTLAMLNARVANMLDADNLGYAVFDVLSHIDSMVLHLETSPGCLEPDVVADGLLGIASLCVVAIMSNDALLVTLD